MPTLCRIPLPLLVLVVTAFASCPQAHADGIRSIRGKSLASMQIHTANGDSSVIVLSDAEALKIESLKILLSGDTLKMLQFPDMRLDFMTDSTDLHLKRIEGRTWSLTPERPVTVAPFPSRTLSFLDSLRYSRFLTEQAEFCGKWTVNRKGTLSLVCEEGDTLRDVTSFSFCFAGNTRSLRHIAATSDSVPAPVSFRATFFITEQSAYPVAVYREYQWKDTDFSAFSYYPLPEHPDDYDVNNKAKGKKHRFNPSRDSEDEGSNPLSIGDMSVKVSGNDVSITLPPDFPIGNGNSSRGGNSADIFSGLVSLCDIQGRVYPSDYIDGNTVRFHSLPPGEYLVTLHYGTNILTRKFLIY